MNALKYLVSMTLLASWASAEEEDHGWEMTGAAGLTYTDGNSDSVAYSIQVLASYLDQDDETYLGADYFYAEDSTATSTDRFKIFGQQNRRLNDRWHVGGYASWLRDDVAGIDRRIDLNLLLGYRAIDTDRTTLVIEGGPGYTWEKQDGMNRDFATLRVSERFEFQFTELTKIWQSLAWTPRVDDLSDSLLEFELGLDTRITDHWSIRTFIQHRVDSTPAMGRGRDDTALILGVAYDLGGLGEPEAEAGRRSLMPGLETADEPSTGWESSAALGFSMARGNSDNFAGRFEWNSAYRSDEREFFLEFSHEWAENNGNTSLDRTRLRTQYNRYLTDRFFVGGTVRYLRDDPADVDYRLTPSLLAGYSLIKTEKTLLALEAAPSYTFERLGGEHRDFVSFLAGQRLRHEFNERISLEQSLIYAFEVEDPDNHEVEFDLAIDMRINDLLVFRVGMEYTHENRPAPGRVKGDLGLTSSIAMTF